MYRTLNDMKAEQHYADRVRAAERRQLRAESPASHRRRPVGGLWRIPGWIGAALLGAAPRAIRRRVA
jgi:hypothetical protein